jgi:iron complex outermembrane receptor protein
MNSTKLITRPGLSRRLGLMAFASGLAFVGAAAVAPTAHAQGTVNEVVVTAQKREQSLQDVSLAVTAVGAQRLEDAHINNLQDLQLIVPSVTIGNDFNMAKIFVRGVGSNTSTTGSETGVAVHVDGAVVARAEAQLTSLFDVDRIEVLRGPQGTLYGRNATGGSINIITNKPTADFGGYGRLTYGNYNMLIAEGAVGGPISDKVLGRVAFKSEDRGGFGTNPVTGNGVDSVNRYMVRGQLMFLPSDKVDFLLSGEWFKQDDTSGALHYRRASFPGVARLPSLGVGGYAARPRDLASEFDPSTKTTTWAVTGTLNWRLNDNFSVTDIANYRKFDTSITQDLDLSSVINSLATTGLATSVQRRDVRSEQYSNELQLKYASDWLNGVLGAFYFHERQRPVDTVGLGPILGMAQNVGVLAAGPTTQDPGIAGFTIPGAPSVTPAEAQFLCNVTTLGGAGFAPKRVCINSNLGTEAWAVFGQTVINLGHFASGLDTLSLKLGGRYSHEKRDSENPAMIIVRNGLGPVLHFTSAGTHVEKTFSDFTPEVGLEWKPSQDLLFYYTYSEGFKSGAGENAAGSRTIVGPENINNHEVGLKSSWLDRRLAVNISGFSYKLYGLQTSKTINDPVAGFVTRFENAAAISAKGFEIETFAQITDNLRLSTSLSYLDSKFDDFTTADPLDPRNVSTPPNLPAYDPVTNPTGFSPIIIQLAGNPTRNSPKWAWNIHGEYDIPGLMLPHEGTLTLAGDVSYRANTYFTEFHRLLEGSKAYTMVDASLTYTSGDNRMTASVWGKNLGDTFRPSSTFALATGRLVGVTYMPPRTYGGTVGYKF